MAISSGPSTRDVILTRIGEITGHLDDCVAARRPEDFVLTYHVATRKRKRDLHDDSRNFHRERGIDQHRGDDDGVCGDCRTVGEKRERPNNCGMRCGCGDGDGGRVDEEAERSALRHAFESGEIEEGRYYPDEFDVERRRDLDTVRRAYGLRKNSDCCECDAIETPPCSQGGFSCSSSSSCLVTCSSSSSSLVACTPSSSPDVFVSVLRRVSMNSVFIPRLLKLFVVIQENLGSGRKSTKRDVYYQNVHFWKKQRVVDDTVDLCAKILRVPRNELGVIAASKGQVAGDLSFLDASSAFHDATNGILIPDDDVTALTTSRARRILVVEKQATYQHALSSGVLKKGGELDDCVVVTGCGYPDYNTRKFVRLISRAMALPVLLLVDCDPHGIHIALVYKFGSSKMKEEEERLTVPEAKWIGILPEDILRNLVPSEMLLPLTDADWRLLSSLSSHPDVVSKAASWAHQMGLMKATKRKAEIQSFAKISPDFLVKQYLPLKIKCQGWLD